MADTLEVHRIRAGLTQSELAEKLNVSAFTISMWENGKTEPRLSQAKELANIFNCSLDDIIFLRSKSN